MYLLLPPFVAAYCLSPISDPRPHFSEPLFQKHLISEWKLYQREVVEEILEGHLWGRPDHLIAHQQGSWDLILKVPENSRPDQMIAQHQEPWDLMLKVPENHSQSPFISFQHQVSER